jgi:RimJ/RimL family protein N-acetyltransferase
MQPNPFRSARLVYCAVEDTPEHDDVFNTVQNDPAGYANSNARLLAPQSRKATREGYQDFVANKALLGVIVCLPPSSDAAETRTAPTPIGTVHLKGMPPHLAHHRQAEIGIDIMPKYQGQGYGSEAIRWITAWGFRVAGLHRISLQAFGYNEGAVRLYERLGFVVEGRNREAIWFQGRFHDNVLFGLLEHEWEERMEKRRIEAEMRS